MSSFGVLSHSSHGHRLKRTGIVSVENPVERAAREGRLADIDDDDRVEELE